MKNTSSASILRYFKEVCDPRIERSNQHQLEEMFFIPLRVVFSAADNPVMVVEFARARQACALESENSAIDYDGG